MLLNLSNHPSALWQPGQTEAAKQVYGKIEDLSFPNIPPAWNEEQVEKLATEFAEKCCHYFKEKKEERNAIHIMGEQSFCFAFVTKMASKSIPCIASTTERIVEILNTGERKSTFRFIKFRRYSPTG